VGSTRSVNAGSKWVCAGAGLAGPVSWLACLGDGPISPSTRVMNTMSLSLSLSIYIYMASICHQIQFLWICSICQHSFNIFSSQLQ
jgi:uncharacterized integral membrane protein